MLGRAVQLIELVHHLPSHPSPSCPPASRPPYLYVISLLLVEPSSHSSQGQVVDAFVEPSREAIEPAVRKRQPAQSLRTATPAAHLSLYLPAFTNLLKEPLLR